MIEEWLPPGMCCNASILTVEDCSTFHTNTHVLLLDIEQIPTFALQGEVPELVPKDPGGLYAHTAVVGVAVYFG